MINTRFNPLKKGFSLWNHIHSAAIKVILTPQYPTINRSNNTNANSLTRISFSASIIIYFNLPNLRLLPFSNNKIIFSNTAGMYVKTPKPSPHQQCSYCWNLTFKQNTPNLKNDIYNHLRSMSIFTFKSSFVLTFLKLPANAIGDQWKHGLMTRRINFSNPPCIKLLL